MKLKSLVGILCFLTIVITAISCEKDKAVLASGSLTFKIDSAAYSANSAYGYIDTTVKDRKLLVIEGVTGTLNKHIAINIYFKDSLQTGTFTEAEDASILFSNSLNNNDPTASFLSETTRIQITSINSKYAEGTFTGVLKNGDLEKPLTDGIFKVNISTVY